MQVLYKDVKIKIPEKALFIANYAIFSIDV